MKYWIQQDFIWSTHTPSQTENCNRQTTTTVFTWYFYGVTRAIYRVGNYMFRVNNRNTGRRCEICSKLTIKAPERHHWRRVWSYFTSCCSVSIVNFENLNADWVWRYIMQENYCSIYILTKHRHIFQRIFKKKKFFFCKVY